MSANFVLAAGVRPVLSAVDQTLDTTTQKTFQVLQTAATSGTGTITWSYSLPSGVSVFSSGGTQITFLISANVTIKPQTFVIEATNQVGQREVKTFRLAAGVKPVLISPGPLSFDTSTIFRSFSIAQIAAAGDIQWSYVLPGAAKVISSSNTGLDIGIDAGKNVELTTMVVTATNIAGIVSTPISFDLSAYIAPVVSGSDQFLDTSTLKTFTLTQTVSPSATGAITWSYSGGGSPTFSSSSDSSITFSLTTGGAYRNNVPFTVTATNVVGVAASKTIVLTSGSTPILSSAATTLIVDSSVARTYTINQTVLATSTGPLVWNGGYPPSTITYTNKTDTGVTLNVAQGAVISTPAVFSVVAASGITRLTSAPLEFSIKAAATPVLVSPGAQNLDTRTGNSFTVAQTAQYTGGITWTYSPKIPGTTTTTSDSGITFSLEPGASFGPVIFTATATNVIGVSASTVIITVRAAVKPVLVSPTQLTLDTTTQQTFTIAQTSAGPMEWSYTFLPAGVTAATSNSGITFTVAAETYFSAKNFVVQATNLAQVSTVLGVHLSAGVAAGVTMNFGGSRIGPATDDGVFQPNAPPPGAAYPSASLFLASPTNPQTYDVYGQPYGNGTYIMAASSVSTNMSNAFSFTENVEWSSSTGVYTAGAYTGARVTYVDGVARSGEWIQLQIPDSIIVTSIQLIEVGGANATSYVIAGSNDGSVWYSVYEGTGSASAADFFTTMLSVTGVTTAYTSYRYIATATNPASTLTSLGGLQVIGTSSYVSPKLVNPRKLTFIVTAEQLFSVQQTTDPAATGALAWSTAPYLLDNSPLPASPTTPSISIANPYTNAVAGSFTGLIELTNPKLDVDILRGDFTIEFWVYGTSTTNFGTIISRAAAASLASLIDWQFYQDVSSTYFQMNTFRVGVERKVLSPFVWNHVAIVNTAGRTVLYVNGISIASTAVIAGSYTAGRSIFIGGGNTGTLFAGQLADVRIVTGYAVYASNFTVPSAPLTPAPLGQTLMLLQVKPILPAGFSVYAVTSSGITFAIAADTVFTDNFTVQVQNLTGGKSTVTFFIDTTPTPPALSAATPFVVPTYVPTTFSVFQTASPSLTGPIDWSYTTLPVGVTETIPKDDTQITFAVAQYAVPYQASFTVSASADFGITSLIVVFTGYGNTPVLTSASPYVIASSAGTTFTVTQSALYTGTITWTYGTLPSGVSFSSSNDTGITFVVATGSTSATTIFSVTAVCFYGTSNTNVSYTSAPPAGPVSSIAQTGSTSNPSISLTWAAGSGATSYSIVSTPATTTQTTAVVPYTFTGLAAATVYTFTVTSGNFIGAFSSPVTSGNMYTSAAPSALVVGSVSGTSIPLSWTAGFGVTSYSITSSPATTTQTTSGTSLTFTGLTGGTPYLFTVRSVVPAGSGGTVSSVLYVTPAAAVASITSITITSLTSATVTWPGSASASSYSLRTTPATTTQTTGAVSFVKTGLTAGIDYTVSITSINSYGAGGVTTSGSFVIPNAVTNLSTGNQQITAVDLAWTPSYGATGYTITTTPATTAQTTVNPTYTFTGLSGGTLYTFTVTSTNSFGSGGTTTSGTVLTRPAAVTGITPSNYSLTTVDMSWAAAAGAASYIITTTPTTTTQTVSGTSITKTGLTAGTSYIVNIQSVNASGNGGTASSASFFTLPLAVTNLTPSNPQITTADLTWTASVGATSYKVTTTPPSTTQSTTGTAFTKTGLVGGTTYTFTVTSVNSSGDGGSVISSSSIVTRPAAVLNLTALNPQNTSMGLSWTASPSDILVTYTVTTTPVTTTQTTTGTTLTKTGLSAGVLYTYFVLATNASGDGGTSSVSKITLPPQVTSAATTNPQQLTMGLTWTDALGATSYSIASSPAVATSPQTASVGGAYTFTGLTAGIQYTFTITSINASGSGTVTASPAAVYTLSPAVASVTTSNPLTTTMDLTWPASTGAVSYSVTSSPTTTTQTLTPGGTFTGLTAGTVYTFTVAAINSSGSGGTTTSASRITRSLPPASLTPAAAAAINYIDLTWPSAVGAVSYTVVSTPTTGTFTGVTATSLRFTGLASGTSYTFTVSSVNASGTSETSRTSASALTFPDPPASITPSNATVSTVDLNWTAAIGTDTYTITTTPSTTTRSGLTGTSYTFPGLSSGISYIFNIRSVNASGTSPATTSSVGYFTIPAAVSSLNTSNPQQTSIDLSWTDVTGESSYSVSPLPPVGGGYTMFLAANTSAATFPAGGSGYSLTAGTSYVFRITPSNSSGTGAFTDSTARFSLPAVPTLSGTSIGGVFTSIQRTQLTVNWIAPAVGTTTGYSVTCPGLTTQTITAPTTSATFTGLTAGTSYTFTIQSINASGGGGSVTTSAVFTLPAAVTSPTTSGYTLTGMTVGWTGATGATSYSVSAAVSPGGGTVPATQTGIAGTSANFSGLSSGYSYTFTISSVNASGTGDLTTATTAAKTLSPAPGQPTLTGFNAASGGTTQIQVSVTTNAQGATSNIFTSTPSVATSPQTSAVYPYIFTGLSPNTSYTFTAQSVNASGASGVGGTSIASAGLFTLPNPVTLSGTDIGGVFTSIQQAQMTVNWNAPTGGASTYNVSIATTDGGALPANQTGIAGTSATFLTLTPGRTYNYTITAVNSGGNSSTVTTNNVQTLSPAPGTATLSGATKTSIVVTYAAATGAASYNVTSSPASTTTTQVLSASGGTFTGLTPNTSYTFTVQAINPSGSGGTSAASAALVTLTYAPTLSSTIVDGVFTSITSTGFTINWLAPSIGTAASYAFSGVGYGTTSVALTGVTAGSTNGPFTITSRNSAGVNGDNVVTTTIKTLAAAASNFAQQAGTATNQTVVLTWTNATGAESYILVGGPSTLNPTAAASTGYTVSSLASPGTAYSFTLQSRTNVGISGGPSLGGTTGSITAYTAPSAPSSLATGTPTGTTIPFTWGSPGGTVTSYTLTGANIPGGFVTFSGTAATTSYTLGSSTPLTAAVTYGPFTLTASNSGGTSGASNQAAAVTTVLTTPTGLNVTGVSTSGFTLNWSAVSGGLSYVVTGTSLGAPQTVSGTSATYSGLAANTGYGPITVTPWSAAGGTGTAGPAASTGSGTSGTVYTVPNAPGAPAVSSGTATSTEFTATWTAPSGTIVSYSITGTGSPTPTSYTLATNSQAYTGLTAGNGYVFTVTATGPAGFLNTSGPATQARTSAGSVGTIYTLSPAPSAFAAGATDPRLSTYGNGFSGSLIQSGALEVGYGTAASQNIAFATNPTFTPGATAIYTFSFDLYISSDAPSWRNLMNHGPSGNANSLRTPAMFITGNDYGTAGLLHYNHWTVTGGSISAVGSVVVPKNQWYNITATCDGTTCRVYMNGAIDNTHTFTSTGFKWPAGADSGTAQNWFWNSAPYGNAGGSVQVKNCYFWNGTCLTATQASYLAYPIASTQLSLGWTAANGATSYTTAGTNLTTVSGITDRIKVYTGLAANTSYGMFSVYSINGSSNGTTNGGLITAGGQSTPPGAPTISSATATAYNNITVSWGTIGGATSYTLAGYNIVPAITGITGTSYNLTTSGGTTYGPFTVTAVNGNGSTASATFGAVTTVPAPVSGFAVSSKTSSAITFGWGGGAGATSFTLSGSGFTTVTGITGTSYTLGSLAGNSSYGGFTLTPVGAGGSGTAGTTGAETTLMNAPTLGFSSKTATSITFSITAPSGGGQTSYNLADSSSSSAGLQWRYYTGYFNDNVSYFAGVPSLSGVVASIPDINAGTGGYVPLTNAFDYYSVEWTGYFLSDYTGTWTFYTNSDDASFLWIGANATSGFTTANATVNNAGLHGMVEKSGTVSLVAGQYYPIRIQFGENGGGDNMIVSFERPGLAKRTDGAGFFFIRPFGTVTGISSSATSYTVTCLAGNTTYGSFTLTALHGTGNTTSTLASVTTDLTLPPPPLTGSTAYTSPGTFTASGTGNIRVLVVAGGGQGGPGANRAGGGGGAGGVVYCSAFPVVSGGTYPITVGAGGYTPAVNGQGNPGSPSTFSGITALGGGGGEGAYSPGLPGGSGGGGGQDTRDFGGTPNPAGSATQPGQPQPANCTNYGNPGTIGGYNGTFGGAGGGGAGGVGGATPGNPGGVGGVGITINVTGSNVVYAGGGGGATQPGGTGGAGGAGGGGTGASDSGAGGNATYYGGGGGAGASGFTGGAGYSGIVIIVYP